MATLSRRQCIGGGTVVAASGLVAAIRQSRKASVNAGARGWDSDVASRNWPDVARVGARRDGVFLWTRTDADVFARARATQPELAAAVHVATIVREGGGYTYRRALSPLAGGHETPITLVVRIDDSVHSAFDDSRSGTTNSLAAGLTAVLDRIVRESRATGARFDEILLDYDAPMRALSAWAAVVLRLSRVVLTDVPIWVTSLPAHLEDASYGDLFAGRIAGHVIQLFDTGLACTPEAAARLARNVERHRLPFRVAIGAFERARAEPFTAVCWQAIARRWKALPRYAGFWIFPAGQEVASSLRRMSGEPLFAAIEPGTARAGKP